MQKFIKIITSNDDREVASEIRQSDLWDTLNLDEEARKRIDGLKERYSDASLPYDVAKGAGVAFVISLVGSALHRMFSKPRIPLLSYICHPLNIGFIGLGGLQAGLSHQTRKTDIRLADLGIKISDRKGQVAEGLAETNNKHRVKVSDGKTSITCCQHEGKLSTEKQQSRRRSI